ncbi:GlsB/YeaQ/YmgE family stress response membrane protein [Actinotalea sp. K2]|uniref:GlsB/YeaQ/YmgE family stress response membrane protein n=1 Tax=Actinotalea sp. K2 TaxID=2939438 RepID=UPI002017F866|nr:GlsB/YeaQ/YmgE family stress response membrane protein [Actinotalea sp. K2]MCL3863127.1 GlsB/YeaQ/YmgE family stress response membrane protein [Actinotalea sp. K2]
MTITGFITAIVIGAIIGALGRLFAPGKQDISIIATIIVGILAALIGTAIVQAATDVDGFSILELLVQIGLAVVGVIIASRLLGSRKTR